MGAGKKKLERALSAFSDSKISKPVLVPGALGGYIDGYQQIQVAYRQDFVYVRLRTTDSETIQAFNDKVGIHWDLPVLVYRDPESPGVWRIYGRDIRAYDDWEGAAYNNPHAESHSFAGAAKTGADVVWTFKRQYMPLLMHPNPTGTMGVYIEPDFYVYQGQVRWWPGSGSTSLAGLKPTGSFTGRFVTVYLNSAGVPAFLGGDEFSALDVPTDPSSYIEIPSTTEGVPLGAVLLLSGTEYIGWGEIYDLRLPNQAVFPMSDVSGSLMFYDEATLQGSAPRLNVTGERLTVRVSGSYATIHASPDPVEQIGVFNVIDPPGSALGTGTVIEWGDNLSVTISGTTVHVDATAGGGVAHVFPGGALVIPDLYPLMFTWTGSANDLHTNNATWEDIEALSGTFTVDNPTDVFIDLVASINLADGSWNHNWLRVVLDAVPLNPVIYYGEDGGHNNWEVFLTYHAVQKNIASGAHTIEAQWYTTSNLNVNIQNRRLSLIAATGGLTYRSGTAAIGVLDEGIYLGAGNIFNFRGQNVEVTISGSAVDVFVTGSSGGGGHETGTLVVYDEGTFLGVFEEMRFLGAGVDAYNSGSYAAISIPGGGGVTVNADGIMGWDEGIPVGTGSVLNVTGDGASLSISGTVLELNVPGPFLQDDGAPLGYLSAIDFVGAGVTATLLGSQATITIPGGGGGAGGVDQIGIYGLDEGVPLGTGTWVNFRGPNVEATISGTVIDVYVSGSSGGGGHQTGTMVIYDEGTFLGVFEEMRFIGAGVQALNSGSYAAVSIPGGGTTFAGVDQIGIYALDEGVPLGTGTWVNFRGPNVEASISGTVIDVYISGSSGGGGHQTGTIVVYDEDTFVGVFEEMRFIGGGVNAYNSGSYAAISIPVSTLVIGTGTASLRVPDLLNSSKLVASTPDDDFDGVALDGKWTVVQGNPGTVGLIGASGGIYQVGARSGWLSMQVGTAATGTHVQIRQDYALPSGSSIVIAVSCAMDLGATPTNNEIWLGVGVNQTDTGIMSGTSTTTLMAFMDASADGIRAVCYNIAGVVGWDSPGTPHIPDVTFFRIDRAGLVYRAFYSTDGFAWTWIGSNTLASEATNIWIYALCRATSANRMLVGVPWIREGTALTQDPWTLNSPETFASIAATDDGAYLGTATVLEGRKSLDFSISGTTLAMDVRLMPQDVYQGSGTFTFPSVLITGTAGDSALSVCGGIQFYGGGTVPAYFGQGAGNNLQMASNISPLGNLVGDTTKSQWKLVLGAALDQFSVRRSPAGVSYAEATLLTLGGSGTFYLANGMYLSDVPGAYMGSGTINARQYYKDGVPLTTGLTVNADGVLVGTASTLDILGPDVGVTISGTVARIAFPGSYDPDWPPITGSSFDDEFNDGAIATKWTGSALYNDAFLLDQSVSGSHASESYYSGYLLLQNTGFTQVMPIKSITQPFTIVAKVSFGADPNTNDSCLSLTLKGQASNTFYYMQFGRFTTMGLRTIFANAGGAAEGVNRTWPHGTGFTYLMLTHDGAKNFSWYASSDGFTWSPIEVNRALSNWTSVETYSIAANGVGAIDGLGAVDFIRYWPEKNVFRIGRYT